MAIIKIKNPAIDLDAAEIPNLDASKITTGNFDASRIGSGTFSDARIAASNVSQHATSFDDNKIVNDISTLALRQASDQNKSAYNTNSQSVDVFQDDTGIDTTTDVTRNASEYVDASVETSDSTSISWAQRADFSLHYTRAGINGATYNHTGNAASDPTTNLLTGYDGQSANGFSEQSAAYYHCYVFDLGANTTFIPTHMDYYFQNGSGSFSNIKTQAFNNLPGSGNTNPSDLVTFSTRTSIVNDTSYTETISTSTKFRYLAWVKHYSNGSNWGNNHSWRWRGTRYVRLLNATGNFTGTTITAPSSVSSMGAIITYQDQAGTNALNTDIVLQLSADGGSNYSTATLTALPDFSTGIKMAKVNDLAVTVGTQLKYKINFANQAQGSKEARIRGVALQY